MLFEARQKDILARTLRGVESYASTQYLPTFFVEWGDVARSVLHRPTHLIGAVLVADVCPIGSYFYLIS